MPEFDTTVKRALIITYYWPPAGGSGVQRWVKFSKYFPEFGWKPIIYTPENPEYPTLDHSLSKDIPEEAEIIKRPIWEPYSWYKSFVGKGEDATITVGLLDESVVKSKREEFAIWLRGNLFIPDARKFWIKPSVRYLSKYLTSNPIDVIITTGPPHSMHLIGKILSERFQKKWVADFRDPWTGIYYHDDLKLGTYAQWKHEQLEREVVTSASKVVVISPRLKNEFKEVYGVDATLITNGFDEEDYEGKQPKKDEAFTITHTGFLSKSQNPEMLWKALSKQVEDDEEFKAALKLKLIGKVDATIIDSLQKYGLLEHTEMPGYVDHEQVVEMQISARVLLYIQNLTGHKGGTLNAKLFEYLAVRNMILNIGNVKGDAAHIISDLQAGYNHKPNDYKGIKATLEVLWDQYKSNNLHKTDSTIEMFSRRFLAKHYTKELNSIVKAK